MIEKHLAEELPFMATENILMYCVKKGGDRQELHERIRQHSINAAKEIKQNGSDNDLIKRILSDETFNISAQEMEAILNAESFCGRAKEQTEEFLREVKSVLDFNKDLLGVKVNIKV